MHIVLVSRWFPPHSGGGGVAAYNFHLSRALAALGHKVTILSSRLSPTVPALEVDGGVHVHRLLLRERHWLNRIPIAGRYMRGLRRLAYSVRVWRCLEALLRREPADVVEFAEVEAEGFVFQAFGPSCPVIVRCHTPFFVLERYYLRSEMGYDTSLVAWMEKFCIRHAQALTAPSRDMAEVVASACGISAERFTVFPNPLRPNSFRDPPAPGREASSGGMRILYVGRLERGKGVEVLAEAAVRVLREVSAATFVFVGGDRPDGKGSTWRNRLEARFRGQGLWERVSLVTTASDADVAGWYARADIAVVPSLIYESFSYTCAQAMEAGVPVVASRVGGIPETVADGRSGLIVETGDARALGEAIIRLAKDPEGRRAMGRAGRQEALLRFDPGAVATQFLAVVSGLHERSPG